jgi:hypothetical protein
VQFPVERCRFWRVVVWGSGFGTDGGLCRTAEEADDVVDYLIRCMGWQPEMVTVEEIDLTHEESDEIARLNRPSEWFTGPRGGTYRLSGTGRSRIYI